MDTSMDTLSALRKADRPYRPFESVSIARLNPITHTTTHSDKSWLDRAGAEVIDFV